MANGIGEGRIGDCQRTTVEGARQAGPGFLSLLVLRVRHWCHTDEVS